MEFTLEMPQQIPAEDVCQTILDTLQITTFRRRI